MTSGFFELSLSIIVFSFSYYSIACSNRFVALFRVCVCVNFEMNWGCKNRLNSNCCNFYPFLPKVIFDLFSIIIEVLSSFHVFILDIIWWLKGLGGVNCGKSISHH